MLNDEKKAIDELTEIKELVKEDLKNEDVEVTAILNRIDLESLVIVLNLIEKQQKEIEEQKKKNKEILSGNVENFQKYFLEEFDKKFISKDKLKEILGIEETDSEKILSLLQTIVDENNRLEDIEDRKVQVDYEKVFNKGVKSVEDKIKAKIKELESGNKNTFVRGEKILVLQSVLRKE